MGHLWRYSLVILCIWSGSLLACGPGLLTPTHEFTTKELKQYIRQGYQAYLKEKNSKDSPDELEPILERIAPPKIQWSLMGKVERERYMARSIMPIMLLLFQEHNYPRTGFRSFGRSSFGSRGTDRFSCLTCHGVRVAGRIVSTRTFDFSSPTHLYPLDPQNMPSIEKAEPFMARKLRFMKYIVTPAIRVMLGNPKADCFTCHARKKH